MTAGVFAAVVLAGAAGAVARAAVSGAVQRRWQRRGTGTLVVNLAGAFALGFWVGLPGVTAAWVEIIGTGFLGAFTTFSTWMAEAAAGWRAGRRAAVAVWLAATLVLGVGAAILGGVVGRALG